MPQAKNTGIMQEDTTALPQASTDALADYSRSFGSIRVNDLLQYYNGNKSELAQALAGTSDKSSTAYKTQMKNVSRYLNYEKGDRGKQARNPNNAKAQARFRDLMKSKRPPTQADISMTGWLGYNGSWRWRSIGTQKPIRLSGSGLSKFLDALSRGDTKTAYTQVFSAYGAGMLEMGADDNPQINITFH